MATILQKANEILDEKNEKLLPENLRKDVTCLGVTGTLEELVGEEITITPDIEEQVITPTEGKNGITKATVSAVTNEIDANITAENIKKDVSILGVTGTLETVSGEEIEVTPTTEEQIIEPSEDKNSITKVTVKAISDENLLSENIKAGVTIFGITGTYTGTEEGPDTSL